MNQVKTGKFINTLRREKGFTQLQLADKLGISDKTISKWERGVGLPDVSLMLPLCEILDISVNELLTGEKVNDFDYKMKAEKIIMDLVSENRKNKMRMIQSVICGVITIIAVCSLIVIAAYIEMSTIVRSLLIIFAVVVAVIGIAAATTLEINTGYFECPNCKEQFVPTTNQYVKGYHTFTKRR